MKRPAGLYREAGIHETSTREAMVLGSRSLAEGAMHYGEEPHLGGVLAAEWPQGESAEAKVIGKLEINKPSFSPFQNETVPWPSNAARKTPRHTNRGNQSKAARSGEGHPLVPSFRGRS